DHRDRGPARQRRPARRAGVRRGAAGDAAGPPAARHRHVPGHADPAGGRPGALDPAHQRRALGRPDARDGHLARPRRRVPGARQAPHGRRRRRGRADAQGSRRNPADPRPGRPARRARRLRDRGPLPRRPRPRGARRRRGGARAHRADAQRAAHLLEHHRGGPVPARGAPARGLEPRGPERPLAPDRGRAADQDGGEAGAARGARRRAPAATAVGDPRARARGGGDRDEDPVPGPVRARQDPARVRPAPAAQGDPGRARRARPAGRRGRRAARPAPRGAPARERPGGRRPRALAPGEAPAGGGRARDHPHLPRVARDPALVEGDHGQPRSRQRARGARRRPLRHRARQGPDPRVPRRPLAQARRARLDPLPRRAPRRRQDLARPVRRPGARAHVRAHQRGRGARRGRDPRPPPHLHRRDARDDRPRAARRRLAQPAVHDRRDRQDGLRLPRRPGERHARGARPGAERRVPRPLPRRPVRPLRRDVHHDGQHARHHPGAAARPHGGHRARGLHGGGEAPDRAPLPRAAPDRAQRPQEVADRLHGRRAARDRRGLHPRGGRAQPRARDRDGVPQGRPQGGRGDARDEEVHRQREAPARPARPPALPHGGQAPHERPRRRHRPRVDAGRRRRPLRRGHRDARHGAPDHHGPARRRDEGVRPGRPLLRPRPRPPPGPRPARELVRDARHPHPRAGGRDPQGRPERRDHDGHGPHVPRLGPARPRGGGDDRRADPDGPGAADRGPQGEGARRAARRPAPRDRSATERVRRRGHPGAPPRRAGIHMGGGDRRGPRRGARDV
ncbi:MAG: ATP-dependent protease La Type I, partial [uncultured Solirubrobacteraceae bacterium]